MLVASLPMYDWPEVRPETDARWAGLRDTLRARGIDAPERLARSNADLPAVPGGIRDPGGAVVAPDPATLPPDAFDLAALWRHPQLLLAQTCWGPMELGLQAAVTVLGQPSYDDVEGGSGPLYSSAILMRGAGGSVTAPAGSGALLPVEALRGRRLAFNGADSMSGLIALTRDLHEAGHAPSLFATISETGSHRASLRAVARGEADVCAVDARSWALARRHEPLAADLHVAGWTGKRPGLPYVCSRFLPAETVGHLRGALAASGMMLG